MAYCRTRPSLIESNGVSFTLWNLNMLKAGSLVKVKEIDAPPFVVESMCLGAVGGSKGVFELFVLARPTERFLVGEVPVEVSEVISIRACDLEVADS